ncbi:MAG TPA: hypothetical protein VFE12_04270, partial [Acetobacteraceae bacterium]|nr:hypothetical protein [Acetobacteraceae bacterium]
MTIISRTLSLTALSALALATTAFAQGAKDAKDPSAQFDKVLPQKVPQDAAVPGTSQPVVQPLPAPAPQYPVVQQWSTADATRL